MQAGLLAAHGFNPYRLGYFLLKEVEERWDKGRFGPEYEALPLVELLDANHGNRGELLLAHAYEGVELDLRKTKAVLENLHRLWGRPVHLKTVVGGKEVLLSAGS